MDRWSTPHGMAGNRNWESQKIDDRAGDISVDKNGDFIQGPVSMQDLRGQKAFLYLESGQIALLVQGERLRAVFLDGGHHLEIGHGTRQIGADHELYLLSTDAVSLHWTKQDPLHCTGGEASDVIGKCRLRITAPASFYRAFWLVGESCDPKAVINQIDQAVRETLAEVLAPADASSTMSAAEFQSRLTQLSASDLSDELELWGLECISLAAYTAAPPVEGFMPETAGQLSVFVHN